MPMYDYRCPCGLVWEEQHTIAERDVPVNAPCPVCGMDTVERYLPSTNGLSYTTERLRTPNAFKDVLRNIKKNNPHSNINV